MKIPEPRKLSNGKWFIQLRLGGKSYSVSDYDKNKCIAQATSIKAGLISRKSGNRFLTLSEAIDNYIEMRSNILSPSTIRGYRSIQNTRFKSSMDKSVMNMNKEYCQRMCNLEKSFCSAKTLSNAWGFISSVIFDQTGERYVIRLPQIIKNETKYLEPDQIKIFIKAIKGTPVQMPALLALHSLRRSEILGLKWQHIDLDKKIIKLQGSMVLDENSNLVSKPENKNSTSNRVIPIMIDDLYEALLNADKSSEFVVNISINSIYKYVNKICQCADLPLVGVHGLRHSFASLAYHINMPEKVAMEIGGWANDQTMRKIYIHVAKTNINKYSNIMSEFYNK